VEGLGREIPGRAGPTGGPHSDADCRTPSRLSRVHSGWMQRLGSRAGGAWPPSQGRTLSESVESPTHESMASRISRACFRAARLLATANNGAAGVSWAGSSWAGFLASLLRSRGPPARTRIRAAATLLRDAGNGSAQRIRVRA
jgi:hypothetical protein